MKKTRFVKDLVKVQINFIEKEGRAMNKVVKFEDEPIEFVLLHGKKIPVDPMVTKEFPKWRLKPLKVFPFEKVAEKCVNVVTPMKEENGIRDEFRRVFKKWKIYQLYYVSWDEFERLIRDRVQEEIVLNDFPTYSYRKLLG